MILSCLLLSACEKVWDEISQIDAILASWKMILDGYIKPQHINLETDLYAGAFHLDKYVNTSKLPLSILSILYVNLCLYSTLILMRFKHRINYITQIYIYLTRCTSHIKLRLKVLFDISFCQSECRICSD